MTELDYIIQNFDLHFSAYQGCKIALSSGEYLEPVVDAFGQRYCFHCILGPEDTEVPEGIDLVILTDRRTSKEPDYHRIRKSCETKQVPLLDLFGLDQLALHRELAEHHHLTIAQWKELLIGYDVISLFIPNVVADFDEQQGRWILRYRFPTLFNWLKSLGKTVVIFWEKEDQIEPLIEAGIISSVILLQRKGSDLGFLRLAEQYHGKRIIHVGVGTVRDGIVPREYGMESRVNRYFTNSVSSSVKGMMFCEDRKRLLEAIDGHDVVSFDIFDTLIKRVTLYPKDVFDIVEERTGIHGFSITRYRIQMDSPQLSLEEIYDCLKEICGYDDGTLALLRGTELAVESEVIMPRNSMVELFDYAKSHGKIVVLVSDMYLDPKFVRELLERCGITGYDALHLSCQYGKLKQEGLFEALRDHMENGETILHVGDNPHADVASAERFGLDAIPVASCLEMAKRNGYAESIERCRTLGERKLLGLAIAIGFDNPFIQDSDVQIANMIVAPLAMSYLQWAAIEMAGKGYDRFLFFARDGWMLLDAYGMLRRRFSEPLPPGLYFYANRHASFLTVMDDYQLVKHFLDPANYQGDPYEMLHRVFCIPVDRLLPYQGEPFEEYYRKNAPAIREAACHFRKNYRSYLAREGILEGTCAVMDFVSEGNTQKMLEQNLPGKTDGYYVGIPEYLSKDTENISYFLDQDLMNYETEMKLEVYFTSSEPALDSIGDDGYPVFADEVRDGKTLNRINKVQALVRAYLDRYLEVLYDSHDQFDKDLIFQLCEAINQYDVENCYFDDMLGREIQKRA